MSEQLRSPKSLFLLGAVVAALAIPTVWSWITPIVTATQVTSMKAIRGLASLETEAAPGAEPENKLSHPITIEWNLRGHDFKKEIQGTHLRLKGLRQGMKSATITNSTNGFTASIFEVGPGFTTDFIELKPGSNKIEVEVVSPQGKAVTRRIEITRRAPAAIN